MGKKKNSLTKITNIVLMIVGIVALVGIGGLFIDGAFLNVVILKWLPQLVHTVVGWVVVIGALMSGAVSAYEALK